MGMELGIGAGVR